MSHKKQEQNGLKKKHKRSIRRYHREFRKRLSKAVKDISIVVNLSGEL